MTLSVLFLVAALVFFLLAVVGVPTRINLLAAGFVCFTLAALSGVL